MLFCVRVDFKNNKIDDLVTVRHRDVCKNGFPNIEGGVDAVFLDLPTPWEVVTSAKSILVPQGRCLVVCVKGYDLGDQFVFNCGYDLITGRICSFSPCMEQVQRTCLALAQHKFTGDASGAVLCLVH